MTAREGFGLAIRIAGGWEILQALGDVYYILVKMFGLPTGSTLPILVDINSGLFKLGLGVLLLLTAKPLIWIVYGPESKRF